MSRHIHGNELTNTIREACSSFNSRPQPPATPSSPPASKSHNLKSHSITNAMKEEDYYSLHITEDEKVVSELQAAGHNIYGGLVTCLRQVNLPKMVGIPRFRKQSIETMVRVREHIEFVRCMMEMNEGKYGPVPRVFTQIGWFVRLFDKYPTVEETYYDEGLKPRLFTEAFHQMYETKANMYWAEQKLLHPDLETEGLARDSDCTNANYIYKIDAAGALTVLKDRSSLAVDSETGEFVLADGEKLIIPWAGDVNRVRKANRGDGDIGMNEAGTGDSVPGSHQGFHLDAATAAEDSPMEMELCIR